VLETMHERISGDTDAVVAKAQQYRIEKSSLPRVTTSSRGGNAGVATDEAAGGSLRRLPSACYHARQLGFGAVRSATGSREVDGGGDGSLNTAEHHVHNSILVS